MTEILEKLYEIKAKSESLYRNKIIRKVTRDFFMERYNYLAEELENYRKDPEIANRENIIELINEIDELYNTLESIESGLCEQKNKAFLKSCWINTLIIMKLICGL